MAAATAVSVDAAHGFTRYVSGCFQSMGGALFLFCPEMSSSGCSIGRKDSFLTSGTIKQIWIWTGFWKELRLTWLCNKSDWPAWNPKDSGKAPSDASGCFSIKKCVDEWSCHVDDSFGDTSEQFVGRTKRDMLRSVNPTAWRSEHSPRKWFWKFTGTPNNSVLWRAEICYHLAVGGNPASNLCPFCRRTNKNRLPSIKCLVVWGIRSRQTWGKSKRPRREIVIGSSVSFADAMSALRRSLVMCGEMYKVGNGGHSSLFI